jgi:transposase
VQSPARRILSRTAPRKEEIATMWRFTRNNGITEGFHNKMETIGRQA